MKSLLETCIGTSQFPTLSWILDYDLPFLGAWDLMIIMQGESRIQLHILPKEGVVGKTMRKVLNASKIRMQHLM